MSSFEDKIRKIFREHRDDLCESLEDVHKTLNDFLAEVGDDNPMGFMTLAVLDVYSGKRGKGYLFEQKSFEAALYDFTKKLKDWTKHRGRGDTFNELINFIQKKKDDIHASYSELVSQHNLQKRPKTFSIGETKNPCWNGYEMIGMKTKDGDRVPNCVPVNENDYDLEDIDTFSCHCPMEEAEYQGREVKLNKPMRGDRKKYKVYVKNDKGNVIKVEFGDPDMEIKRDDPERRKNFRARHNCDQKKDKTKAGYWSCKLWSNKKVSDIV